MSMQGMQLINATVIPFTYVEDLLPKEVHETSKSIVSISVHVHM